MDKRMLLKAKRLDSKGVALVMSQGRAIQSGSFLLKLVKNGSSEQFKAAFVAPKKAFKTAVLRNKAKRRGRAAFGAINTQNSLKQGQLGVFLFRPAVLTASFQEIKQEIEQVLLKNAII